MTCDLPYGYICEQKADNSIPTQVIYKTILFLKIILLKLFAKLLKGTFKTW